MSSWIFCLVLILMLRLAFTLVLVLALSHVLCLTLLLVLRLSSLMDPTIAHMVLVHERTTLSLDALVMAHVLIVVYVPLGQVVRCKGLWKPLLVAWLSAGFLRFISLTPTLNHRPFLILCR
jgi:hypothetical protein